MATFPGPTTSPAAPNPSYGSQKQSQPNIKVVKFGDGYEKRLTFGLNQNPKVWSLEWSNISEADSDTIEDFLDARNGAESFDWTPLDETTAYKWVCESWTKSVPYTGRATIQASFRQVFE
jgi:phage-related protein